VSRCADLPARIYHLTLSGEWDEATKQRVAYRRSTLGKSLEEEGFIHCSFASQVQAIADVLFQGREDVVLLTIDPSRVDAQIRVENLDGGEEFFPHIYGASPLDAVAKANGVPLSVDGCLLVDVLLAVNRCVASIRPRRA
jgi:uncharacterized protein (DUF952 family)